MRVQFYQNYSDRRDLSKIIRSVGSNLNCKIKEDTTMLSPTLVLSADSIGDLSYVNYCYIDTFKRYYFTGDTIYTTGGIVYIPCEVDVLYSNRTGISNINALVLKNEFEKDKMVVDPDVIIKSGKKVAYRAAGELPSSFWYYLTVTGGNVEEGE